MKIVLASNSPRRKELLKEHNIDFEVIPSNVEEKVNPNSSVYENVMNLASIKCVDVFDKNKDRIVLAADTIVVYENEILGKPRDEDDAFRMLKLLSGHSHEVITGVCVMYNEIKITDYVVSTVIFKQISDEEIYQYIKTKEPMDKAGSYAIQGIGAKFIKGYDGEYDNIVGLPMKKVLEIFESIKK